MNLNILNDDGTVSKHTFTKENHTNKKNQITVINSSLKEENALRIINSYCNNNKTILFDNTNKTIEKKLNNLDLTIFDNYDFNMMFFTSGSTGNPVGALKTKFNLEEEIKAFTQLVKKYNIKQVIVTVPFVHIYGTLIGLLYPLINDIDIVLKEHFLPNDLLDVIDDNSLIVTTPLYIKALNQLTSSKNLNSSLFISSTAPLDTKNSEIFISKFNTTIIQLFGSTETSGIAYKTNCDELWTPLKNVEISINNENELKVKSPFISDILYENDFINTDGCIQTFDYIEQYNDKFKLVGRSSKIFKIAGKRYSTIQIENILENTQEINKAVVFVYSQKNELRGERLSIIIESQHNFSVKEIRKILQQELSNIKFSIDLKIVDEIKTTAIGKKIIIQ